MSAERNRLLLRTGFLLTVGAVLLISDQALFWNHLPHTEIIKALLPKVGEAIVVAVVIAFLVDLTAKKELLSEFLYETSTHIIGRQLPPAIREEIRSYLGSNFVRTRLDLTYTLTEIEGHPSAVILTSVASSDLENHSTKPEPFNFVVEVDDTWLADVGQAQITHVGMKHGDNSFFNETLDEAANRKLALASGVRRYSKAVDVPPLPTATVTSVVECTEFLPSSYLYPFITLAVVSGANVRITYRKERFKIEVSLASGDDGKVDREDFTGFSTWKIKKPLLPGQGIIINWQSARPKDDTDQKKDAAPGGALAKPAAETAKPGPEVAKPAPEAAAPVEAPPENAPPADQKPKVNQEKKEPLSK